MKQEDIDHLKWTIDRLVSIHGDSENSDFVLKCRRIIKQLQDQKARNEI